MQSQSHFLDIYRSMARVANDSMLAQLQSAERIHQKQLDAVRSALEQSSRSAKQLTDVQNVDDLLSTHSQIIGAQVAQTMELWRTVFRAMGDAQITMLSQMQSQMGQATETVRQAYDLTKKATDDATRMVASQVSAANFGAREGMAQPSTPPRGEAHRKSA